jgi:Ca2+-transporting ATPase
LASSRTCSTTTTAPPGANAGRALTFTALVASCLAIIITNRSWSRSIIGILRTPNAAQWWVVLGTVAMLAVVLVVPFARGLFTFAPLDADDLAISVAAGVACVGWFEWIKRHRRRHAVPGSIASGAIAGER